VSTVSLNNQLKIALILINEMYLRWHFLVSYSHIWGGMCRPPSHSYAYLPKLLIMQRIEEALCLNN
jgi:hypothetical protein